MENEITWGLRKRWIKEGEEAKDGVGPSIAIPRREDAEGPHNFCAISLRRNTAFPSVALRGRKLVGSASVRSLAVCAARDDTG